METRISDHRDQSRRSKVLGFIIAETVAIIVLLAAGTWVVAGRPVDSSVVTALNVVMFVAARGRRHNSDFLLRVRADPAAVETVIEPD